MPVERGKGFSENTLTKQGQFRDILWMHMRCCSRMVRREETPPGSRPVVRHYLYLDLFAGDGVNHVADVEEYGSPVIAARYASKIKIPLKGFAFELNPENADRLRRELGDDSDIEVLTGDHHVTIHRVIPHLADVRTGTNCARWRGLIYCDPTHEAVPVDLIRTLYRVPSMECVDALVYASATLPKRVAGGCTTQIEDSLRAIGKRYCFLRVPDGQWQWVMAYCTNWVSGSMAAWLGRCGFHEIGTPEGQEIVRYATSTEKHLKATGWIKPEFIDQAQTSFKRDRAEALAQKRLIF